MTLWYEFGGDENHEPEYFEYDLNYRDIENYLMNLPNEELEEPLRIAFKNIPEKEQKEIMEYMEETNFDNPNFLKWLEEDKDWCITEFLTEPDILELFEDELHDAFENEAYKAWEEALLYRKDPYAYNGLNRKDFY